MHPSVMNWIEHTLTADDVTGATVLEVGSYDVNGSVRPYIMSLFPERYVGVDAESGPSVDWVLNAEELCQHVGAETWDVVISCEMLEHAENWRTCLHQMIKAAKPGGRILITTRSPGFPYHAFPGDYWRFTTDNMWTIANAYGLIVDDIRDDPEAPGVFVNARKSLIACGALDLDWITVAGV